MQLPRAAITATLCTGCVIFPHSLEPPPNDQTTVALLTGTLELVGEFDLGRARILSRARITYAGAAPARHRGSPTLAFTDEAEAMLGLRIGHHHESYGFPTGNGYFAALAYRELLGARFLGITIGYSLDVATRRRRPL